MKFIHALMISVSLLFAQIAFAKSDNSAKHENTKHTNLVGKAKMTYYFWDVYDVYLYTATGKFDKEKPFTLKLTYLQDFNGKDIAERSIEEIEKQGFTSAKKLEEWSDFMQKTFPDVQKGSSLVGVVDQKQHTTFLHDGKVIGKSDDTEFTKYFFDIWLNVKTSQPEIRKQLLGVNN